MVKNAKTTVGDHEEQEVMKLPTKEDVVKTIKKINTLKANGAKISGEIGQVVQNAEDKMNIHRAAAKKCASYVRMDPVKRNEELFHLAAYLKHHNILHFADLFEREEPKASNVTKLKPKGDEAAASA